MIDLVLSLLISIGCHREVRGGESRDEGTGRDSKEGTRVDGRVRE